MVPIATKEQPGLSSRTGIPSWGCPLILILILAPFASCTKTREVIPSATSQVIEAVPFYPQEKYQCGPASLAGVLNYWGLNTSPDEIAEEIYSESARGTLSVDMVLYAEKRGLKARQHRGSFEEIRANIDSGYPLVVLVDYGVWIYEQNHFMVVVGYDERGIIANSGKDPLKSIRMGNFMRSWERTDFWTLLITPK